MITVQPSGSISFCQTPLENDYKNQLTFSSRSQQQQYFRSTIKFNRDESNYTYIKKDNIVKVNIPVDQLQQCNYLFYRNVGFTDKIYYCFITKLEYISENVTAVSFETDVIQTWYFEINYKPCFIERETVLDDTFGKHTIPEGLQLGEMVSNGETIISLPNSFESTEVGAQQITIDGAKCVCFQVTETLGGSYDEIQPTRGRIYNGLYSGLYFMGIPISAPTEYGKAVDAFINAYANAGKSDSIVSIFIAPSIFFAGGKCAKMTDKAYLCAPQTSNVMRFITSASVNKGNTIDGYTPRNNKLFTKDFNYLYLTNYTGSETIYNFEDGENGTINFTVDGCISQGSSIKIYPNKYKNMNKPIQYGLGAGKYPQCAWSKDYYTNWVTQNAVNISTNVASGLVSAFSTASLTGVIGGATSSVLGAMAQIESAKIAPDQAKGDLNAGDFNLAHDLFFTGFRMSVRREMAEIIDKYFDMYGYKVNKVKVPSLTGRQNWNYIKTIDANMDGNIPETDLSIIRRCFNNGIWFWHNPLNFYNFNQSNNIV